MDRCFWAGNGGGRATVRHTCLNMRRSGGKGRTDRGERHEGAGAARQEFGEGI